MFALVFVLWYVNEALYCLDASFSVSLLYYLINHVQILADLDIYAFICDYINPDLSAKIENVSVVETV